MSEDRVKENEFVELTEQILANQPGGGAFARPGRRLSVDTTTLKFAKFLQKWCDGKGITSIVKYNFNEDTELYDVDLELMGTKGNWHASDGDIRSALNEVSRLAIVQLVKMREMSTSDMPTTLASTFKLDTTVKLK